MVVGFNGEGRFEGLLVGLGVESMFGGSLGSPPLPRHSNPNNQLSHSTRPNTLVRQWEWGRVCEGDLLILHVECGCKRMMREEEMEVIVIVLCDS